MSIDLSTALLFNSKSINYSKICLFSSWQIATADAFSSMYESHDCNYIDVLNLENKSSFIHQIVFTNWRMFVIEICKIYDKHSSQSLYKVLNKILYKDRGFRIYNFDRDKILAIWDEFELSVEANSDIVNKLKELRDKFYAHRDFQFYTQIDSEVKFRDGYEVLLSAEQTLQKIATTCNFQINLMGEEELHNKTGIKEIVFLSKSLTY